MRALRDLPEFSQVSFARTPHQRRNKPLVGTKRIKWNRQPPCIRDHSRHLKAGRPWLFKAKGASVAGEASIGQTMALQGIVFSFLEADVKGRYWVF